MFVAAWPIRKDGERLAAPAYREASDRRPDRADRPIRLAVPRNRQPSSGPPYPRARCRKADIWPRVTGSLVQKVVGVQPLVMPAAARALMSCSKVVPLSSLK